MTLSPRERAHDRDALLGRLALEVGDQDLDGPTFRPGEWGGLPTTWFALVETGHLRSTGDYGEHEYWVTPAGWLRGLEITGALESPELRQRAARLVRAFNEACDRTAPRPLLLDYGSIQTATGVPAGWVLSAVKSGLLQRFFPDRDMGVYWDPPSRGLRIPPTFQQRRGATR